MRLAVFTNQFPGRVSTFFARDMRGLLEGGIEIDIFSVRPIDPSLWGCVPDILSEQVLPRQKVKDTRAALVDHFKEGRFMPAAALFAPDKAAVSSWLAKNAVAADDEADDQLEDPEVTDGDGDDASDAEAFSEAAE